MKRMTWAKRKQRGCGYCLDHIPWYDRSTTGNKSKCPYDECPYHELDNTETYDEYADSISPISIAALMAILCKPEKKNGEKENVCLKKP